MEGNLVMETDIIAYCKFHNKDLSLHTLKIKNCLCKDNSGTTCRHLKRYTNHKYWQNRKKRYGDIAMQSKYMKFKHV